MNSDLSAKTLLQTIVEMAPALREAGVLEVAFHGVAVKMAPHEPKVETGDDDVSDEGWGHPDALQDPRTYRDGKVPGFSLRGKK